MERELKLKKHYLSAIGEKVKVTFSQNKKDLTKIGTLKEVLPDIIKIEFNNGIKEIPFLNITKTKTYFDYKK